MDFIIIVLVTWFVLWALSKASPYEGPTGADGYCYSPANR